MKQIVLITSFIVCGLINHIYGQIAIPYHNSFDNANDTIGWTHYDISGTDDWEIGLPNTTNFNYAFSSPNAWVTDLDNDYAGYSERVLETPFFNLTDTTSDYVLSFYQKRHSNSSGVQYYLEYSNDNGNTWQLLDDVNAQKKNWQGSFGFSGNYYFNFQHSAIDLGFIQGQDSIKFRFRFVSSYANGEGWMIDNFNIDEEYFNIYATQGDSVFVSQHCPDFDVKSTLGFYNQYSDYVYNTTYYYFSMDPVLDSLDTLIATKSSNINWTVSNWTQNINMLPNLTAGYYYIIYEHDVLDSLQENDETDNIGYAVLVIEPIFNAPYIEDFETNADWWETYLDNTGQVLVWQLGQGYRHHLEGVHSGMNAWHTSKTIDYDFTNCGSSCNVQYVESPFIDLTTDTGNLVFNIWFKDHDAWYQYNIQASDDCGINWTTLSSFTVCRDDDWDFINVSLNAYSSDNCKKFRIKYEGNTSGREGIIFDDLYIGTIKPDLSIERDKINRFTSATSTIDSIKYFLNNSGLAVSPQTSTAFYWSNDTILDGSDIFLGTKQEQSMSDTARVWTYFTYTKPTLSTGEYYIFYILDSANVVNEMREYNNTGYFTITQDNPISVPYFNDFESQINGWKHNASLGLDEWQCTVPNGTILDTAFSGINAWVTNDTGLVSPMSRMHLYTPVFDFSTINKPVLEFDMKLQSYVSIYSSIGNMNMSYSIDGGATWIVLDTTNISYNRWYYPMKYNFGGYDVSDNFTYTKFLFDINENAFMPHTRYNSRDVNRNYRYILGIDFLAGASHVQFRFNLASISDNSLFTYYQAEGALIDNFSIGEAFVDLNVDYKKSLMISSSVQDIKFFMNIKNQGNYVSTPSVTKYYVSNDTILDGSDYFLGSELIPEIRPDMYYYVNSILNAPNNLGNYKYLLYELDAYGTNPESNETNNIGYWNLALDSISSYPYFMDFNDTIIDGWHHYVKWYYGAHIKNSYRFRNILAPSEVLYQSDLRSGEMFTDIINETTTTNMVPYWYLETPVFNFSEVDSIPLSFDLMCTGDPFSGSRDGGNMEFSIDGGNTWTLLTTQYGQATNWYNYSLLDDLNDESGWSGPAAGYGIAILDPRYFNLSFLRGLDNVVFRLKYRSCSDAYLGNTQGLRIDNFRVEGFTVDYITNDTMVPVNATLAQPDFTINYSITNLGQTNGRVTTTKFYWSNDSVFDANDSLIHTITESAISSGATYNSSATITYPIPIIQTEYYLFYITDGDSNLVEINEFNNLGVFKIVFDLVNTIPEFSLSGNMNMYVNENYLFVMAPTSLSENSFTLKIINTNGQMIYNSDVSLCPGLNRYPLPTNLSSGIYLICLQNSKCIMTRKISIQNNTITNTSYSQ